MKISRILSVAIVLCAGTIFCGEERQMRRAWAEALRRTGYELKTAVAEKAKSWWSSQKKSTEQVAPQLPPMFEKYVPESLKSGVGFYQAGTQAVAQAKTVAQYGFLASLGIDYLVKEVPMIDVLAKGGRAVSPYVAAGAFVVGVGIHQVLSYYHAKDITKAAAVNAVKDIIRVQLSEQLIYPTRTIKINALLKKNEFLLNRDDVDDIVALACDELIDDISKVPYNKDDEPIDKEINTLNAVLLKFPTVEEKIDYIKNLNVYKNAAINDFSGLLLMLQNARVKATLSVFFRLQKQQMFEALFPEHSQEAVRKEIAGAYKEKIAAQEKYSAPGKVLGGKRKMTAGERENYLKRLREARAAKKQSIPEIREDVPVQNPPIIAPIQ